MAGLTDEIAEKTKLKRRALQHRKYVWNDFSIVDKAKIKVLCCRDGVFRNDNTPLDVLADLTVQINPSGFEFDSKINPKSIVVGLKSGSAVEEHARVSYGEVERSGECTIPLVYDIYDEYYARSMGGALTQDFSLANEEVTSLPDLFKYASTPLFYAMFVWGNIKKFGSMGGMHIEYKAFSEWGQPLKATASLKINEIYVRDINKLKINGDAAYDVLSKISDIKTTGKKILTGVKNLFR